MGTSSSTERVTEISPRAKGFKAKKGQELTLDSPALLDLDHGSIRYRLPDEKGIDPDSKVKTGYFYHPKLSDYSEDAEIAPEEKFKLYYVFKGPKKDGKNKKLYYVYATSVNAKDGGLKQAEYRPQGLGYDWPESYRKANNLYYELSFIESSEEEFPESDEESDQLSTVTTATPRIDGPVMKDNIRMIVTNSEKVESLMKRLAFKLLIPAANFHITHKKQELRDVDVIGDLRTPEDGAWDRFAINLHLT